jgi:uncharacterized membrane protein YphA (DoxX/SURF4 family)
MSVPSSIASSARVVGVVPWLPWPLSAWPWWTEPVRAERLAALRIGLAFCLLLDILLTYHPGVFTYFSPDALGDPTVYGWLKDSPRLTWSLLHGFGDPLLSFLALAGWVALTVWMVIDLSTRLFRGRGVRERDALRYSMPLWVLTGTVFVLGIWARLAKQPEELRFAWVAPLAMVCLAMFLFALELLRLLNPDGGPHARGILYHCVAVACALVLFGGGAYLSVEQRLEPTSLEARLLAPWREDPVLLHGSMIAWVVATSCLLVGLFTRPAAIATWALSLSFANLNDSIDNAGDTIRCIILFYLMLCPCGAVWSVDRLWQRLRGDRAVLYVAPWAVRILFVQLIFIYWCNGIYKLVGPHWRDGYSLRYVLADITLVRFSLADLPVPDWLLRAMTWSVLVWEVSFPVLVVLHRWTRVAALLFGVAFHLGIFLTMELGFFVPYALCLYLPLVPWERWLGRRAPLPVERTVDVELALAPVQTVSQPE